MQERRRGHRISSGRGLARATGLLLLALLAAPMALASDTPPADPEQRAERAYWQNLYRGLLDDAERLRAEIERETELYADANRRNYRRGKKRHVHRVAAENARDKLAEVEAKLATIEDDARRAGALPGWFYEVEIEREDAARRPAISSAPDDGGRNPLFLEDDEGEDDDAR